jgi:hypothetical protein
MKRALQAIVVLLAGLLSGCALIQKGLEAVTPEISVGIWKDNGSGVTIGVKLEKNKTAPELTPAPAADEVKKDEAKKEEEN